MIKVILFSVHGAILAQRWQHRFQTSTSLSKSENVGGSSSAGLSIDNETPKINTTAETASLSFETALLKPPPNFTTLNSTNYGILMNLLSDKIGKIHTEKHVKAAKKLLCSLPWMTRDELVKE